MEHFTMGKAGSGGAQELSLVVQHPWGVDKNGTGEHDNGKIIERVFMTKKYKLRDCEQDSFKCEP